MDLNIHPPLPKRKDFRIGILGSGFIVDECHLVAYRKAGFNPVAIASRNRANATEVATAHNISKVFDTYDDLLADPTIEVLDIAVPPNALLPLIRKVCDARIVKGVLAQKPLGMNYAEALEMVTYCERAGITLAVNQNMRFDQSVRAAKTLLTNGTIGEPVIATIEMRGIPHWQPWQAELGWATLRIMSIHHLDTFRYWFGSPQRIFCSTRPDPRTKFSHTDGICVYILEYANGLRCIAIDDTWTGPAKEGCPSDNYIKWRIEGLNGLAIGDIGWCRDPYTTPSTIRYAAKGQQNFESPIWPESWFPDAFIGTMADLLIALENNSQPAISGRDNLKTMQLVEGAYRSARFHYAIPIIDNPLEPQTSQSPLRTHTQSKWSDISARIGAAMRDPRRNNFTPRAVQVLALARKEADRLNHNFVGTEHVLLGLIVLGQGCAVTVLAKLGLNLENVRNEVEKQIGVGPDQKVVGNIPYAPRVKKVLALAARQAKNLHHRFVGTEHILLGLLEEGDGVAARVLRTFNVD
ncbi:MAG TPA: Clp protease N-terminal domain-containing protein, partial [Verrucomicrobiae bacterium]|nr:Clp protease N-terminal domain-containing protein [Verrucomicrobiae bacterium]